MLLRYCLYKLNSTNQHGVHSPFVFYLLTSVIYNDKDYYCYKLIENQRKQLLDSKDFIGATSVSKLAKKMYPEKYSKLLFRLVNHFQANNSVLITDDLGIDTAYVAYASTNSKVYSFQENNEFKKITNSTLQRFNLKNVTLFDSGINIALPNLLKHIDALDFVFINQQISQNVLSVFYQCLEKANTSSVFVISNIAFPEIKNAWEQIKNNNQVTVTVDLFYMGIVFLRKEQVKEHFLIRF